MSGLNIQEVVHTFYERQVNHMISEHKQSTNCECLENMNKSYVMLKPFNFPSKSIFTIYIRI